MTDAKKFAKKSAPPISTVEYYHYFYSTILNIRCMKKMVEFNAFAEWYSGEQSAADIIGYFDEAIGEDVSALIGTVVELEVQPNCNGMYDNWINGEILLESVDNYLECL